MITKAKAVYTGGNIWLFYGSIDDGTYFLVDDDGAVRICNADFDDMDETLMPEWQEEHLVRDIEDEEERMAFCNEMLDQLWIESADNQGGFCEFDAYKKWFEIPLSGETATTTPCEDDKANELYDLAEQIWTYADPWERCDYTVEDIVEQIKEDPMSVLKEVVSWIANN